MVHTNIKCFIIILFVEYLAQYSDGYKLTERNKLNI